MYILDDTSTNIENDEYENIYHIALKNKEYLFTIINKKIYRVNCKQNFSIQNKYVGNYCMIFANENILRDSYRKNMLILEYVTFYTLISISLLFFELQPTIYFGSIIIYTANVLNIQKNKFKRKLPIYSQYKNCEYIVSLDREQSLSMKYTLYVVYSTGLKYICNSNYKNITYSIKKLLDEKRG